MFAAHGISAWCTGYGNAAAPGSSLGGVQFPYAGGGELKHPEHVWDPAVCDVVMREQVLKLGLLLQDVNIAHGLGAMSMAHTDADVEKLLAACDIVAERVSES